MSQTDNENKQQVKSLSGHGASFIKMFVTPMVFGKAAILYFGSMYSKYPGQDYGYYLLGAITFTLTMVAAFLWKFRNYKD